MKVDPFVNQFSSDIHKSRYSHEVIKESRKESWWETSRRVAYSVLQNFDKRVADDVADLIYQRKFIPGGRYLYCAGRPKHQVNNCFLFRAKDSREGWGDLFREVAVSIMTGGGCGAVYSDVRGRDTKIQGMGGVGSGAVSLMKGINSMVQEMRQGGARRAALWGGLHWDHADIEEFLTSKIWSDTIKEAKDKDFSIMAPLEYTNISMIQDTLFFEAIDDPNHKLHKVAKDVFYKSVRIACEHADPGWSFDAFENEGENLRNACTEVTSRYHGDMCNLGSLVMARFTNIDEFRNAVDLVTKFLIAGTEYTDVPLPEMDEIRKKYRRIGVGLMGIHEWMLQRKLTFKNVIEDREFNNWLKTYADTTETTAYSYSRRHGINEPIKKRAIAPTGTISILGETTSSAEPISCLAYKRLFYKGSELHYQYVIDQAGQRAIDQYGWNPDEVEDVYTLSTDMETRIRFQYTVQKYVDQGISSTAILPPWGSEYNNESNTDELANLLIKYGRGLRGFTVYPDGCKTGQPINKVPYTEAKELIGTTYKFNAPLQCKLEGGCGD